MTSNVDIHPELNIERLYYNEVTVSIAQFTSNLFGEIIITDSKYICLGAGWATDAIVF